MALMWKWENKCGEFTFNGQTYPWYEGNALMIIVDEFKADGKDKYNVVWFFDDKPHAKRCLGLTKGNYDMFEGNVEKITIYKDKSRNWKDIVELFTKSQKDIVIEIRNSEGVVK